MSAQDYFGGLVGMAGAGWLLALGVLFIVRSVRSQWAWPAACLFVALGLALFSTAAIQFAVDYSHAQGATP